MEKFLFVLRVLWYRNCDSLFFFRDTGSVPCLHYSELLTDFISHGWSSAPC